MRIFSTILAAGALALLGGCVVVPPAPAAYYDGDPYATPYYAQPYYPPAYYGGIGVYGGGWRGHPWHGGGSPGALHQHGGGTHHHH
jgi:hypothetical protein